MIEIGSAVSVIQDPFNSDSMVNFRVSCRKDKYFGKGWSYNGVIEFENGDTEGTQNFEADSLQSLLIKMEAFVKELE